MHWRSQAENMAHIIYGQQYHGMTYLITRPDHLPQLILFSTLHTGGCTRKSTVCNDNSDQLYSVIYMVDVGILLINQQLNETACVSHQRRLWN